MTITKMPLLARSEQHSAFKETEVIVRSLLGQVVMGKGSLLPLPRFSLALLLLTFLG
jgi:hypothetical protein